MREEGNRRCKGGIPQIEREHRITLAARKGTAPPTTVTSAIRSAATAGATTTTTATREGDEHHYLLDTEAGGGGAMPPLVSPPKTLLVGISTKSPNLQSKKIFASLEGIFALMVQQTLPEVQKFQLFGNL